MRRFGIEIETTNNTSKVPKKDLARCGFKLIPEYLDGPDVGEFVSKRNHVPNIKSMCDLLNRYGVKANRTAGIHIHIDARDFTTEDVYNMAITMLWLDEVMWTFVPKYRRNDHNMAFTMSPNGLTFPHRQKRQLRGYYVTSSFTRWMGCNLIALNKHGTIEFRYFHTELDPDLIKAYLELCERIVSTIKDNGYIEDITYDSDNDSCREMLLDNLNISKKSKEILLARSRGRKILKHELFNKD